MSHGSKVHWRTRMARKEAAARVISFVLTTALWVFAPFVLPAAIAVCTPIPYNAMIGETFFFLAGIWWVVALMFVYVIYLRIKDGIEDIL